MRGGARRGADGGAWLDGVDTGQAEVRIDTSTAHMARVYDYWLGGVTNFAVDRAVAHHAAEVSGGIEAVRASVATNRAFLLRAVRHLVGAGVDQFLDIGSGIPKEGNGGRDENIHALAQRLAPEARTVYVDNDPIVLAHAHQLLSDTPDGSVRYHQGDLRDPESILNKAAGTLDFRRPVAVLLIGILHFFRDEEDPYGIVASLMDAVCPGSYLVVCHLASDIHPDEMAEAARRLTEATNETCVPRDHDQVARFFRGLDLVQPGVVQVDQWRPDEGPPPVLPPEGRTNPLRVGVGRKP